jgi:hypothetical protein
VAVKPLIGGIPGVEHVSESSVVELRGDAFLTASKCNAVEPGDTFEGGIEPGATAERAIAKVELGSTIGCLRGWRPSLSRAAQSIIDHSMALDMML